MEEEKKEWFQEENIEEGRPFFPHHFLLEIIVAYLVIGVVLTLVILSPIPLHPKANPFQTPEGIKPEWYFLAGYQFLKYVPKVLGIVAIGILMIILFLIPFLDRSPSRAWKDRRAITNLGWAVIIIALLFGLLGYLSESSKTILGKKYHFDLRGFPHHVIEETRK